MFRVCFHCLLSSLRQLVVLKRTNRKRIPITQLNNDNSITVVPIKPQNSSNTTNTNSSINNNDISSTNFSSSGIKSDRNTQLLTLHQHRLSYGHGRRYVDAFTSYLYRLRPQLVAASAARPRQNPLRGTARKASSVRGRRAFFVFSNYLERFFYFLIIWAFFLFSLYEITRRYKTPSRSTNIQKQKTETRLKKDDIR
uniref:Uncharacterized protein n=1 Tax=Hyaloperonospora arabidopsidis (strain Emoy2) TaxID=559515 RepID=M4C3L3_HYAAE